MHLGQRHNGHGIPAQACRIATQLRQGWRLEAGGLIDVVQLSAARACYRNIEFPIPLVNQQHAMFAVVRDEGQSVDIRIIVLTKWFNLDLLVAWAKVVVKQLEHPESRVWLAVIPINHRDAGELRGKSDKL